MVHLSEFIYSLFLIIGDIVEDTATDSGVGQDSFDPMGLSIDITAKKSNLVSAGHPDPGSWNKQNTLSQL